MFASAQTVSVPIDFTVIRDGVGGRVLGTECFVGRQRIACPPMIQQGQTFVVSPEARQQCAGTAWRFSLNLPGTVNGHPGNFGQIAAQGCSGHEERRVVVREEARPSRNSQETLVERRVEVESRTETRVVQTVREPFCEVGEKEVYNRVLSCVERSGAGYLRVTEVLYRLVPASSVRVPAECRDVDGSVTTGPACERRNAQSVPQQRPEAQQRADRGSCRVHTGVEEVRFNLIRINGSWQDLTPQECDDILKRRMALPSADDRQLI